MLPILKTRLRRHRMLPSPLMQHRKEDHQVVNAQFVSFLENSGFRKRMIDRQSTNKRIRRIAAIAFSWALAFGFVWVVIESAQALELF